MNWPLLAAGCIALLGSVIHRIVGDGLVRRIDAEWLEGKAKFLIRVTWHFTTIGFVVLGVALVFVAVQPHSTSSAGIAYGAGALFSCWSAFILIAAFIRGGIQGWLFHPAPIMLSVTAALIWWGASWF